MEDELKEVYVSNATTEEERVVARVVNAAAVIFAGYVACPHTDADPDVMLKGCFRKAAQLEDYAWAWAIKSELP